MNRPRLLDLSRLMSRAGLTPTGVDRVERAYLDEMSSDAFGLVRTALGYVLLGPDGLAAAARACDTGDWGRVDLLSRWNRRLSVPAKRGQSFARRHAIARFRKKGLARALSRYLGSSFDYYNVGHSNLGMDSLSQLKAAGARINVLIHDTIPLDFPDMQRDGTVSQFRRKMAATAAFADRVICSTQAAANDLQRHAPELVPVIAPLGVTVPSPDPITAPDRPEGPYFVTVGTIEPRKNHALLLDIWEAWQDAPPLLICGRRGWKNEAVFARLDAQPANVSERPDLTDEQIAALVAGATAVLFPSFAEGYGLPPAEAASLGVPVVVSDLPACREVLGDAAIYLDPSDGYRWADTIKRLLNSAHSEALNRYVPPDWATHFKLVFTD